MDPPPRPRPFTVHGRAAELAQLAEWFDAPIGPLVVTGLGGIGKTTLARRFLQDKAAALFVDARAIQSVDELLYLLACGLGIELGERIDAARVTRAARRAPFDVLVLDNAETLVACVGEWEPVVLAFPRVLVTSRVTCGLRGERELPLLPLDSSEGTLSAAVRVLADRAGLDVHALDSADTRAGLERIAKLTDGIPLALELAATKVAQFGVAWTVKRLAAELEGVGSSGTGGGSALDRCFRWTWDLLDESERHAATHLALFSGAFSASDARRLVGGEGDAVDAVLASLMAKSMVAGQAATSGDPMDDDPRFRLLVPLRDFVRREGTPAAKKEALVAAFVRTLLEIVEAHAANLRGGSPDVASRGIERHHRDLVEAGLRAREAGAADLALRCMVVLGEWANHGGPTSPYHAISDAPGIDEATGTVARPLRHRVLVLRSDLAKRAGRVAEARACADQALAVAESDAEKASSFLVLALSEAHAGAFENAYESARTALELAQRGGDSALIGRAGQAAASCARRVGFESEARALADEAIVSARHAKDRMTEANLLSLLAAIAFDGGELPRAEQLVRTALSTVRQSSSATTFARCTLADVLVAKGDFAAAETELEGIVSWARERGAMPFDLAATFTRGLARLLREENDDAHAVLKERETIGTEVSTHVLIVAALAAAEAKLGLLASARSRARTVYEREARTIEPILARTVLLVVEVEAVRRGEEPDAARANIEESLALLFRANDRGRSWFLMSGDVRVAFEMVRAELKRLGFRTEPDALVGPTLVIDPGLERAVCGANELVLSEHQVLRRLLEGLLDARGPETARSLDALVAIGWPSERIAHTAARNRVHVAISTLRRSLLGVHLRRGPSGYFIDSSVDVVRATA